MLQADAPKADNIPKADVVGVTVILLTCSYRNSVWICISLDLISLAWTCYDANTNNNPSITVNRNVNLKFGLSLEEIVHSCRNFSEWDTTARSNMQMRPFEITHPKSRTLACAANL